MCPREILKDPPCGWLKLRQKKTQEQKCDILCLFPPVYPHLQYIAIMDSILISFRPHIIYLK